MLARVRFFGSEYSSESSGVSFRSIWFMIVTNVSFTVFVWVTYRVRRSTLARRVRWESAMIGELRSWQVCPPLVVINLFEKKRLLYQPKTLTRYQSEANQSALGENRSLKQIERTYVRLSLFTKGLNKIYANVESIEELQSWFHQKVFFRFTLRWLETERNEGLIDHITGWMFYLLFIFLHSFAFSDWSSFDKRKHSIE